MKTIRRLPAVILIMLIAIAPASMAEENKAGGEQTLEEKMENLQKEFDELKKQYESQKMERRELIRP